MSFPGHIWKQLKNLTADEIIKGLEKSDWVSDETRGAEQIYRHPDGRRVSIHYHPGKTYGPKLLKNLLNDRQSLFAKALAGRHAVNNDDGGFPVRGKLGEPVCSVPDPDGKIEAGEVMQP